MEEGDKLDVLLALVEIYEAKRWPIEIEGTFARTYPGRVGRSSGLALACV